MAKTENVELTVLCLIQDNSGAKKLWNIVAAPFKPEASEMDLLTIGEINDMYTEMQRDEEPHEQMACQDDFDQF